MNKEETDLIIAEQNKSTEEILKAVAKVKADYHELCKLKDMRIAELEAEVREWKDKADLWCKTANLKDHNIMINKELQKENADLKEEINKIAFARGNLEEENAELKELIEKYRQAVDKCLHITFMGAGCEVNTIGQYATLVDGYLTDVEGLAKWKN